MREVMDQTLKALVAEVEHATKEGTKELQRGELQKALGLFQLAHNKAQQLKDAYSKRSCAFNLGAVLIALGQPKKGIKLLQQALPPPGKKDGKSNGDLFYNFGLGYEALNEHKDAAMYYELALEEYQFENDNASMEADVALKIGQSFSRIGHWVFSAKYFGIAAQIYSKLNNVVEEANSKCQQAASLYQAGKPEAASASADQSMILCQKISHGQTLGRLYNELGLIYTQCHEFSKAATCFELALPSCRGAQGDPKQEAVVVQNLGAVYNSLGDYQRAIQFHQKAAGLHAQLANRNSQGQCFANLAFAFSQLGDQPSSGEFYLHALQAAKDTDDLRGQWQAMEGLGAVAFNEGDTDKATKFFKQALATLSKCGENQAARERILAKLSDTLGSEANSEISISSYPLTSQKPINPMSILVNDRPRPPSRQEVLQMQFLRQQRELRKERLRSEFSPVARGLGAYDELSDSSLSRSGNSIIMPPRQKTYRHPKRSPRRGDRYSESDVWDDRTRPTTARGSSRPPEGSTTRGSHGPPERLVHSVSEPETKTAPRESPRKMSVSQRQIKGDMFVQRRLKKRPLLRSEGHDSEEEWRDHMREIKSDSSDDEYRERLRPPSRQLSRGGSSMKRGSKSGWTDVRYFRNAMKNLIRSALSDSDEPRRRMRRVNRKRFAGDVGQSRDRSESNGGVGGADGDLQNLAPEEKSKIDKMIDVVTNQIMEATSLISGRRKVSEENLGGKVGREVIEEEDEAEEDEQTEEGGTSEEEEEEEDEDMEAQMKAYEENLRQKQLQNVKTGELNSSIPPAPAPPAPLTLTYEIPVSSADHVTSSRPTSGHDRPTSGHDRPTTGHDRPTSGHDRPTSGHDRPTSGHDRPNNSAGRPTGSADRPTGGPGENFFRSEATNTSAPGCGEVNVTGSAMTPPKSSRYVEHEDEPLYQTIRSLRSTQPAADPGRSGGDPGNTAADPGHTAADPGRSGGDPGRMDGHPSPPLPPRLSEMSRAENHDREAFLDEYQQQKNENYKTRQSSMVNKASPVEGATGQPPGGAGAKNRSRMCAIM